MYYDADGNDFNFLVFDVKLGTRTVTVYMPSEAYMFTSCPLQLALNSSDMTKDELNAVTRNFLLSVCSEIYARAQKGTYGQVKAATPQQGKEFEKTAVYALISTMLSLDENGDDNDDDDDDEDFSL
jgi:hypothetical protein